AGVLAVPAINFLRPLVAAQLDLVGVDDDHVVAVVDMGGPSRLAAPREGAGNPDGERPQALARGVDDEPLVGGFGGFLLICTHKMRCGYPRRRGGPQTGSIAYRPVRVKAPREPPPCSGRTLATRRRAVLAARGQLDRGGKRLEDLDFESWVRLRDYVPPTGASSAPGRRPEPTRTGATTRTRR